MKQIIKIVALFFVAIITTKVSIAQQGLQLNLDYNIAKPLGSDFKEYIKPSSFRGFQGSLLYAINDKTRVGIQSGYNDFYEQFPRQVYKVADGSDVSAVLTNTLQVVPLLAKGEYTFLKKGYVEPYAGLGAGVNLVHYDQYQGTSEYTRNYTTAAFTCDAGILVPFKRNSNYGFRLSTSYNRMPFNKENINNLDTWNAQAGFTIPLK